MNVNVWGPRLWRILHGAVFLMEDTEVKKRAASALFETLLVLLPCAYCRESYPQILRAASNGSLQKMFEKGLGNEFVFRLHNLVNLKLQRQKLLNALGRENSQIPVEQLHPIIDKLYPPISLSIVIRRLECTRGRPFDENDVWFTLFAFVLDFTSVRWTEAQKFAIALSVLLREQPQYSALCHQLEKIAKLSTPKTAHDAVFVISKCAGYKNIESVWMVASVNIPVVPLQRIK